MPILALHGLPTSPEIWSRLDVAAPALHGALADQVASVLPLVDADTVLIGHDMGGVVAAMVALTVRPRALVLTGTALGPYWAMVRATAWPGLQRYFYARHGGRKFVAGAVSAGLREEALRTFPGADPAMMRALAASMRPPPDLARRVAARVPVHLIWGRHDRWYPPVVARAIARATGARVEWIDAGHFAMWEAPEAFTAALRAHGLPGRRADEAR